MYKHFYSIRLVTTLTTDSNFHVDDEKIIGSTGGRSLLLQRRCRSQGPGIFIFRVSMSITCIFCKKLRSANP